MRLYLFILEVILTTRKKHPLEVLILNPLLNQWSLDFQWSRVCINTYIYIYYIWVFPKIGLTPKWMVYKLFKTLWNWMIWGYHYFWKHPYILYQLYSIVSSDFFGFRQCSPKDFQPHSRQDAVFQVHQKDPQMIWTQTTTGMKAL